MTVNANGCHSQAFLLSGQKIFTKSVPGRPAKSTNKPSVSSYFMQIRLVSRAIWFWLFLLLVMNRHCIAVDYSWLTLHLLHHATPPLWVVYCFPSSKQRSGTHTRCITKFWFCVYEVTFFGVTLLLSFAVNGERTSSVKVWLQPRLHLATAVSTGLRLARCHEFLTVSWCLIPFVFRKYDIWLLMHYILKSELNTFWHFLRKYTLHRFFSRMEVWWIKSSMKHMF